MLRESKIPTLYTELFHRHADNPILTAQDWPYPAHTVFNAGACQVGDETVLLVPRRGPPRPFASDRGAQQRRRVELADRLQAQLRSRSGELFGRSLGRGRPAADLGRGPQRMDHRLHGLLAQRTAGVAGDDEGLHHLHPARPGHAAGGQGCRRLSPPLRQPLRDDSSAGFRRAAPARTSGFPSRPT